MPIRRYTTEQLLQLRSSPLVKKPENLPPIEQWIDEVQPQHDKSANKINHRQLRPAIAADASPMGNFSTGQRPSLLQTRTTGSRSDDIVLGPPKTAFASSRSITKLGGFNDATQPQDLDDPEARTRSYADRQNQRKSANIGEKDLRGERESWTATRERKAFGGDSEHYKSDSNADRNPRNNRRENDSDRRNGERQESRWTHKDDRRPNGERQGGWRDHDNNRRDRWDRTEASERDPEWFDEPVAQKNHDEDFSGMGVARTQEDFQKWKAMMAANKDGTQEPKELVSAAPEPKEAPKPRESLKLEGVVVQPFGGFGIKSPEPPADQGLPKPMAAKAKPSRFASMFKRDDSVPEPSAVSEVVPTLTNTDVDNGNKADQEGFMRIMKMLGGNENNTAITPSMIEPKSPPVKSAANGARQRSRFFDATPKSPEQVQSVQPMPTSEAERSHGLINNAPALPVSPFPTQVDLSQQRNSTADVSSTERGSPAMPKTSTPENNIQNLLASQRAQRAAPTNKDTAFLLGLLQGHSSRPPSQANRPDVDFPLWVSAVPEPHAPKPRAPPPPGHIDDHLLRHAPRGQHIVDDPDRRQQQRPPPGFDEQALFMQQQFQQRRNFPEQQGPPQQYDMQNRGIAHQPPNMHNLPPQVLHQQQQPRGELPFMPTIPPPGFGPNMRHPQGFANVPNIFQAPQQNLAGQRPQLPTGYPSGMAPPQPGPPPGFGRGPAPLGIVSPPPPPPGIMPMLPPDMRSNGGLGRGGFDGMYEQRR